MKLKKSKLRKIINEELVRVIMENDVKRFIALKENLDGETDPEGKMAKSQLERSAENAQRLASSMTDDQQLDGWVQAKITKASDYLQSVANHLQKESLLEGPMQPSDVAFGTGGSYAPADSMGLMDPHAPEASEDDWFNNIQIASRILEDLPLSDLPEQVTYAAKMLRDSIDVMTNPLVEEK